MPRGPSRPGWAQPSATLTAMRLPDLFVTNFYGESTTFFNNMGRESLPTRTSAIGLAAPSRYLLGFGIVLVDANNDGWLDLASRPTAT